MGPSDFSAQQASANAARAAAMSASAQAANAAAAQRAHEFGQRGVQLGQRGAHRRKPHRGPRRGGWIAAVLKMLLALVVVAFLAVVLFITFMGGDWAFTIDPGKPDG